MSINMLVSAATSTEKVSDKNKQPYYTNEFVLLVNGGMKAAKQIAEKYQLKYEGQVLPHENYFVFRQLNSSFDNRKKRSLEPENVLIKQLENDPTVLWAQQQEVKKRVKRNVVLFHPSVNSYTTSAMFNDPDWNKQWYMHDSSEHGRMMNISGAWRLGYTGKNIVVTILDDGIEKDHPDLRDNYVSVRMLDGEVTDLVEATALSFRHDFIHIYSASWGPDDDGKTVDGPATLAMQAFENGIRYGRNGLGSIYVWASGNGGKDDDNCNCDGYTNSIYTVSISSATENGNIPWYSEACSSTLASTYSSGASDEKQVVSTDLRNQCTENHTGTSASAPMAAGIIALALEANSKLTWRDVQHLIVETAKPKHLNAIDWKVNGVGKRVSHAFGFGMIDAAELVKMAEKWKTVPTQRICHQTSSNLTARSFSKGERVALQMHTDACLNTQNEINYLEHVQAKVSVKVKYRGNLQIFLTSPIGTNSTLLDLRMMDESSDGFSEWPFMTTHNWGENPRGIWTLEIVNIATSGVFINWTLILHGTTIPLHRVSNTFHPVHSHVNRNHRPTTNTMNMKHRTHYQQHHAHSLYNSNRKNKQQYHPKQNKDQNNIYLNSNEQYRQYDQSSFVIKSEPHRTSTASPLTREEDFEEFRDGNDDGMNQNEQTVSSISKDMLDDFNSRLVNFCQRHNNELCHS
ncbi:unnamed protein product [Didymodactylos carnosus]|uniref:P/Homo B domain-containing protein n=2 Tax=Didymodactylos carnosus TaxID=1234261 RepID=A0A814DH96_9BILA|nr:unnamed protein product [Didymodactylos carnosus]CAF3730914.1 unnamed protein product [Didymodactylos carnosus]